MDFERSCWVIDGREQHGVEDAKAWRESAGRINVDDMLLIDSKVWESALLFALVLASESRRHKFRPSRVNEEGRKVNRASPQLTAFSHLFLSASLMERDP